VDVSESKCRATARLGDIMAIQKDATDLTLYEEDIDLRTVDVVIAATNRDEVNLLVATIAKEKNVPRVITSVENPRLVKILEDVGVERALCPSLITARMIEGLIEGRVATSLIAPVASGNVGIVSFTLSENDQAVGKKLGEIVIPQTSKILAVFDGESFLDPLSDLELKEGYEVVALVKGGATKGLLNSFR